MISTIDWASWGTAVGTLVLAVATFASVRSGNRAGRNAERALQAGLRPVLFASRPHETVQKVRWGDGHWAALPPGRAVLEEVDGVIYMAMSLLNVGAGIAVILGWRLDTGQIINPNSSLEEMQSGPQMVRPDPATFRPQTRDLYSPPNDLSFWQAALRTADDPDRARVEAAIAGPDPLLIDLLYGDQEGGQRTISRFAISRYGGPDDGWFPAVVNHWYLDREGPR
ncbi:MAG: hypothetical protein WAL61_13950 [Acidimicrobiales bacterium]